MPGLDIHIPDFVSWFERVKPTVERWSSHRVPEPWRLTDEAKVLRIGWAVRWLGTVPLHRKSLGTYACLAAFYALAKSSQDRVSQRGRRAAEVALRLGRECGGRVEGLCELAVGSSYHFGYNDRVIAIDHLTRARALLRTDEDDGSYLAQTLLLLIDAHTIQDDVGVAGACDAAFAYAQDLEALLDRFWAYAGGGSRPAVATAAWDAPAPLKLDRFHRRMYRSAGWRDWCLALASKLGRRYVVLGNRHPDAYDRCENMFRSLADRCESLFGPAHSSSIVVQKAWAGLLIGQGKLSDAAEAFRKVREWNRINTVYCLRCEESSLTQNIILCLTFTRAFDQVKHEVEHLDLHREVTEGLLSVVTLHRIRSCYAKSGDNEGVVRLCDQFEPLHEQRYGRAGTFTIRSLEDKWAALHRLGRHEEAVEVARQLLERELLRADQLTAQFNNHGGEEDGAGNVVYSEAVAEQEEAEDEGDNQEPPNDPAGQPASGGSFGGQNDEGEPEAGYATLGSAGYVSGAELTQEHEQQQYESATWTVPGVNMLDDDGGPHGDNDDDNADDDNDNHWEEGRPASRPSRWRELHAQWNLAWSLSSAGRLDEATFHLRKCLELQGSTGRPLEEAVMMRNVLCTLALTYETLGWTADAALVFAHAQRAFRSKPHTARSAAWFAWNRAKMFLYQGQYDEALGLLSHVATWIDAMADDEEEHVDDDGMLDDFETAEERKASRVDRFAPGVRRTPSVPDLNTGYRQLRLLHLMHPDQEPEPEPEQEQEPEPEQEWPYMPYAHMSHYPLQSPDFGSGPVEEGLRLRRVASESEMTTIDGHTLKRRASFATLHGQPEAPTLPLSEPGTGPEPDGPPPINPMFLFAAARYSCSPSVELRHVASVVWEAVSAAARREPVADPARLVLRPPLEPVGISEDPFSLSMLEYDDGLGELFGHDSAGTEAGRKCSVHQWMVRSGKGWPLVPSEEEERAGEPIERLERVVGATYDEFSAARAQREWLDYCLDGEWNSARKRRGRGHTGNHPHAGAGV